MITNAERPTENELADRVQRISSLVEELRRRPTYLHWLLVKAGQKLFLLKVDEITWIEAEGNYIRVHYERGSCLLRAPIGALESRLNPTDFLRIHRSAIVQLKRIRELQPWQHGEYRVILADGTRLILTRKYRTNLQKAIGQEL